MCFEVCLEIEVQGFVFAGSGGKMESFSPKKEAAPAAPEMKKGALPPPDRFCTIS